MLELTLPAAPRRATRILCLGAHGDDIEIGCGGTLLKWLARGGAWDVTWAVFSASAERERELRSSARRFLRRAARSRVITYQFRESFFPASFASVKDAFESLKQLPTPDIIFTHQRVDRHQDHRLLGELTWNTFRRHLVLEYEIPKYEGGLTTPNAYVPLTRAQAAAKTRALLACYASQRVRPWFRAETFEALMRLRAVESGSGGGWAEGFHISKFNIA
jgi:LmbE family N-acetylglucosaminyl deacetylase